MEANVLHCGDNLEIMRGMDDGCIDLIATDPPFNTGKDWIQFNDKWEGGMKGYLKFMEPRLIEMHRLLSRIRVASTSTATPTQAIISRS